MSKGKEDMAKEDLTPVPGDSPSVGHMLYAGSPNCPKCDAPPSEHEVRNHSLMWHDGDVHCKKCGTYVRDYDAG
jgi:hypothetical protein